MHRKSIRDHHRIPLRFRFTDKEGYGITTWPLLNPAVHVASVITTQGERRNVRTK